MFLARVLPSTPAAPGTAPTASNRSDATMPRIAIVYYSMVGAPSPSLLSRPAAVVAELTRHVQLAPGPLLVFCLQYGHIKTMANAIKAGAEAAGATGESHALSVYSSLPLKVCGPLGGGLERRRTTLSSLAPHALQWICSRCRRPCPTRSSPRCMRRPRTPRCAFPRSSL